MKKFTFLFVIFFSIHLGGYSQAYIKFAETPKMQLQPAKTYLNYSISFHALKKSTIYLELKRGGEVVGTGTYLIEKASSRTVRVPIKILTPIRYLKPGNNYSYNLYMYEGGRNDWSVKACKTKIVRGVRMQPIVPRKPKLFNAFN